MNRLEKKFCCTFKELMGRNEAKGIGDYEFYEDDSNYEKWTKEMSKDEQDIYKKELAKPVPNMASYASSSRFIYKSFKKIENLKSLGLNIQQYQNRTFEKVMKGFVRANFDMYLEDGEERYYFEAKCRELFDYHYPYFSKSYKEKEPNMFEEVVGKEYVKLKDLPIELTGRMYFDLKQFVCHVLAIRNSNEKGNNHLIYLLYAPTTLWNSDNYKRMYESFINQYKSAIQYVKNKLKVDIDFALFIKTSVEGVEPIKFERIIIS